MVSMLNVLIAMSGDNSAEGIFFLDLLCATRIGALERQIAQLLARQNNTNNPTGTTEAPRRRMLQSRV